MTIFSHTLHNDFIEFHFAMLAGDKSDRMVCIVVSVSVSELETQNNRQAIQEVFMKTMFIFTVFTNNLRIY